MSARDLLRLIVSNLRRMKSRVAMTAIGVIIGTAAVVVLVSLGAGLQRLATESLYGMGGLDELLVRNDMYWDTYYGNDRSGQQAQVILDDAVLDEIRQMEGVLAVTPLFEVMMQGPLRLDRQDGWGQVYGVDMEAFTHLARVDRGMLEIYRGQVVIGVSVPENFIPWEMWMEFEEGDERPTPPDLLNQTLQMIRYDYNEQTGYATENVVARLQVVGILQRQGYIYDYGIFMPLVEAQRLNQRMNSGQPTPSGTAKGYMQALVRVSNPNYAPIIEQTLKERGFSVQSDRQQLESINQFFLIVQAILGGIGAVALLVAAFGIANTMTMAIYERTREIGLMKAIGATNQDVMSVFLGEAGFIGLLGGIGGVLLAAGLNAIINIVGQPWVQQGGLGMGMGPGGPQQQQATTLTALPLWLPIFAIMFATLVGIVSGVYPAIRAAALSPIRALKYE